MKSLNEYIGEQLSDVKTKWHPKDGLFTEKDPKKIVDYLLKNSKDRGQAMKRLTFYMNRAGDKLSNKTVLNKAKDMLKEKVNEKLIIFPSQVNEKLVINKNYKGYDDNKALLIEILTWEAGSKNNDITTFAVIDDCAVSDDKLLLNASTSTPTKLDKKDDYYFWSSTSTAVNVYIVALTNINATDFLNDLCKGNTVPEQINIHDYYKSAPDVTCKLSYYDKTADKYLFYNKNDINTLIDKFYE